MKMKINLLDIPVFYINMKKDSEKNEYINDMLKNAGFKNINRIDALEDKTSGRRGLSKSQNKALSQIEPPFIILEDDCDLKYFVSEIEVPDDADAIYLGTSAWGFIGSYSGFLLRYKKVDGFKNIYRIFNMLSSHAILYLTEEYVSMCKKTTDYCANVAKDPIPMDVPFAEIQKYFKIYTINKPVFIQKDYESKMSNAPRWTNKRLTDYSIDNRMHKSLYFKDDIL